MSFIKFKPEIMKNPIPVIPKSDLLNEISNKPVDDIQ